MADRGILERIYRQMDDIHEEIALHREQSARQQVYYEEHRQFMQDQVQINREVIRRNEIAFRDTGRVLAENTRVLRAMREELHAQRGAILSVIDRLEGGGASPATG